jgi:eukaryotic-like serine/threonine-protein kinase
MQAPVRVGDIVGDKYRIDEFLGSGSMSVVALAYHLELEQEVAVKFLHAPGIDQEQRAQRFKREARAAARVQSEHVARVLDVGTLPDGCPYIVMERLRGWDLAGELAARGPLPAEEIAGYLLQVCEALAEAHSVGIVHRDLKPENLFLAECPDGTRCVKVLDFGISKSVVGSSLTDLALTRTASFMGSPLYMSPEQMRSSRSVDARADIWSLGTILYEAVSAQVPFSAESIPELCLSVIGDQPRPLREICTDLPPGFETLVERCLEKDRDQRYANVAELAHALAEFAPSGRSSATRAERILALSLTSSENRTTPISPSAPAPRTVPATALVTASATMPNAGNPVPRFRLRAYLKQRRARAFVAACLALVLIGFLMTRGTTKASEATLGAAESKGPIAVAPPLASVKSSDTAVNASPRSVETVQATDAVAAGPSATDPGARAARVNKPARSRYVPASRAPPVSASQRPEQSAAPLPSAVKVDAWDPDAFGGRH